LLDQKVPDEPIEDRHRQEGHRQQEQGDRHVPAIQDREGEDEDWHPSEQEKCRRVTYALYAVSWSIYVIPLDFGRSCGAASVTNMDRLAQS
jgi:hypothetical protein